MTSYVTKRLAEIAAGKATRRKARPRTGNAIQARRYRIENRLPVSDYIIKEVSR